MADWCIAGALDCGPRWPNKYCKKWSEVSRLINGPSWGGLGCFHGPGRGDPEAMQDYWIASRIEKKWRQL